MTRRPGGRGPPLGWTSRSGRPPRRWSSPTRRAGAGAGRTRGRTGRRSTRPAAGSGRTRRSAGSCARPGRPVQLSPLLNAVLTQALRAAAATGYLVDPTVAAAVIAAGYDRDIAAVLDRAMAGARFDVGSGPSDAAPGAWRLHHDPETGRLTVPPGVGIDLGATAKAFAADRAAARIARSVGGGVLVGLGGDIAVAGEAPDGGWRIAVRTTTGRGPRHTDGVDHLGWTGHVVDDGPPLADADRLDASHHRPAYRAKPGPVVAHGFRGRRESAWTPMPRPRRRSCSATRRRTGWPLRACPRCWSTSTGVPPPSPAGPRQRIGDLMDTQILWFASRATGAVSLVLFTAVMVLGIITAGRAGFAALPAGRRAAAAPHPVAGLAGVPDRAHRHRDRRRIRRPRATGTSLLPFGAGFDPFWIGLATVAVDLLIAIGITSALRRHLPAQAVAGWSTCPPTRCGRWLCCTVRACPAATAARPG